MISDVGYAIKISVRAFSIGGLDSEVLPLVNGLVFMLVAVTVTVLQMNGKSIFGRSIFGKLPL